MEQEIFKTIINIPQMIAQFASWFVTPLSDKINISPLGLLSIAGASVIIALVGIHIVRLFV